MSPPGHTGQGSVRERYISIGHLAVLAAAEHVGRLEHIVLAAACMTRGGVAWPTTLEAERCARAPEPAAARSGAASTLRECRVAQSRQVPWGGAAAELWRCDEGARDRARPCLTTPGTRGTAKRGGRMWPCGAVWGLVV